jgi:histone acetyltransferase 1
MHVLTMSNSCECRESIFGYQNLSIMLYYTPDTLDLCVDFSYDDAVSMETHGVKPDNIFSSLDKWLPKGYYRSLDTFSIALGSQSAFTPPGQQLHSYSRQDDASYLIFKAGLSDRGMKSYLSRLQPLLLWFIEAASYIDEEDDKWMFYLVYRHVREAGLPRYSLVAFASVYLFYCYPDRQRPRISQLLVLPHYQRRGHGAELLQEICSDLCSDPSTHDITVEDPSEAFVQLRDFVDCRNALRLPTFQPPTIHGPFQGVISATARDTLKLHKTQARRVYEILRLRATDRSDPAQYRDYRLAVKNRLNAPHQRELQEHGRLSRLLDPAELALTHPLPSSSSDEEHLTKLHDAYYQLETEYRAVIERLAAS